MSRDAWLICGVFLAVRAVALALGVGFDFDNLGTWWQIADPELLRTRLLPTLFYLHSQPPLFNLLIGLALKAGDAWFPVIMAVVYGAVCLGGLLCLHGVGQAVLGSRRLSLLVTLWFCVSPDVLLFSNKLFYDSLVPWLLCMGVWGIYRGLVRERLGMLGFGFTMLATVVLTRSMFHPLWFVAVAGLVFGLCGWRWRVLAGAAGPGAAIGAVLAKNVMVFGFVGLSSWASLNLVGVTVERLPADERAALVAEGTLSPLSGIDSFGPIERLLPLLPPVPVTGEPVLDAPEKANGRPNMNHMAMLEASRRRLPDALAAVRADPGMYEVVLLASGWHFHRPSNEFLNLRKNLAHIEGWTRLVNATVGLQPAAWFGSSLDAGRPTTWWMQVSFGSVLISVLSAVAGRRVVIEGWAAVRRGRAARPELVALAVVVFTVLFVFLVSSVFDVTENNRARYTIAPMMTLAAASVVARALRRWEARVPGLRAGSVAAVQDAVGLRERLRLDRT